MEFEDYRAFVDKCHKEPVKPLTEFDFDKLEEIVGEILPSDFKTYYLKNNDDFACNPDDEELYEESDYEIYSFSPIKYGFSIEKRIFIHRQDGTDYGKKIPFAEDIYGHTYVISLESNSYGHVFFLQHEFEHEQEYELVANSFTDFINDYVIKRKTFLE